jgi:NAD(P)-dependent dehydrogenase (short-subunit alcohol dehydrogenase family)
MAMEGKVAVITGGGSGIGKATAVVLAKEGAVVAIFDTEEQRLREVKQEIENSMGTECFTFAGSVSSEVDTIKFYEQVREKFGTTPPPRVDSTLLTLVKAKWTVCWQMRERTALGHR